MGFSLPPETYQQIENLLKKTHKTRSEFMRQVISSYLEISKKTILEAPKAEVVISPEDINKILKFYYQIIGNNKKKVLVIGLGIISKDGQVLIGQRKEKDPYIKELNFFYLFSIFLARTKVRYY